MHRSAITPFSMLQSDTMHARHANVELLFLGTLIKILDEVPILIKILWGFIRLYDDL